MPLRIFTISDQIAFAGLSGDNNPIHIDPVAARRSMFGQPIVHGIHSLMWALDQHMENCSGRMRLEKLHVSFLKPIGLNREIRLTPSLGQNNQIRIDVLRDEEITVRMAFELSSHEPYDRGEILSDAPRQEPPDLVERETIKSCSGTLDLHLAVEPARRLFPNLARCLCPIQMAALLATTRLVGVKCPGLHSIYSELKMAVSEAGSLQKMNYAVAEFDDRFGLVLLAFSAPGLAGTIKAFIRPQPQAQPAFLELQKSVNPAAFAGQNAIIVGGSRGLGEVAAKLLAAGGAHVMLTYHLGKTDTLKIADEITAGGGKAGICEFDVLQPRQDWSKLAALTSLYYFASPYISGAANKGFSADLFNNYCKYYVSGFACMVESLYKTGLRHVYYPSTVFIDEMPVNFIEYVLAKIAGEQLCQAMGKKYPGVHFYCPRLPKMATDQTVSLQSGHNPDPAPIILKTLQNFQAAINS